ncbi:hypothetical protein RvY_19349, partial [Ramazzottius varieornatus]
MPTLYVSETGDDVYRPSKSKKFTLYPVEYRTPLSKKELEEELKYHTGPLRMCFLKYGGSGRRPCLLDTFNDTYRYLEFKSSAGPTITSSSIQQNQSGNYGGPYGGFDSQSQPYGGFDSQSQPYGGFDSQSQPYGGFDSQSQPYGGFDSQSQPYGGFDSQSQPYGG